MELPLDHNKEGVGLAIGATQQKSEWGGAGNKEMKSQESLALKGKNELGQQPQGHEGVGEFFLLVGDEFEHAEGVEGERKSSRKEKRWLAA